MATPHSDALLCGCYSYQSPLLPPAGSLGLNTNHSRHSDILVQQGRGHTGEKDQRIDQELRVLTSIQKGHSAGVWSILERGDERLRLSPNHLNLPVGIL